MKHKPKSKRISEIRPNKKGIAFEEIIFLIIGIVFLVVVLYIFVAKGLAGPVKAETANLACSFSAFARGMFIDALMTVWDSLTPFFWLVSLTNFVIPVVIITIGISTGTVLTPTELFTMMLYSSFLSKVPIMCPAITLNVGYLADPATTDTFSDLLGSKIINTYSMFGSGEYDPLIGLTPPNPRTVYVLETHLDSGIYLNQVFDKILLKYSTKWPLSAENPQLYVYCPDKLGNIPADFGTCLINNSRVYVMYKDNFVYDELTYTIFGSKVCGGIKEDPTNRDAVVLCVEQL